MSIPGDHNSDQNKIEKSYRPNQQELVIIKLFVMGCNWTEIAQFTGLSKRSLDVIAYRIREQAITDDFLQLVVVSFKRNWVDKENHNPSYDDLFK